MRLLVGLALFELRDQISELRIPGIEDEQLAGVPERCGKVPLVARHRDERHQDVAIRRVLLVCLLRMADASRALPLEFNATAKT